MIKRDEAGEREATILPMGSSQEGHLTKPALFCFSHLRWDFVFQRPQHLMVRMSTQFDVYYWEEPIYSTECVEGFLEQRQVDAAVTVATPRLPAGLEKASELAELQRLLKQLSGPITGSKVRWYYTPMMLDFSREMDAVCTVYDCMDELSQFRFAPPDLIEREHELLALADVVFTGGHSLYEAKRGLHRNIHPFPSSVDREHFARARHCHGDLGDQTHLPHPRLGYFGVIDERIDLGLLASLADSRPEWSLVMIGPVVKIDPSSLPRRPNIFYLGKKPYEDLPYYLAGWDVALMPFALNDATRYISPTKTPEYLAGGRPVVSTNIRDVRRSYGHLEGVLIAQSPREFVEACENALRLPGAWLNDADAALDGLSWDRTHSDMVRLVQAAIARRTAGMNRGPARAATGVGKHSRRYDFLIVGAGFAGSVLAERLGAGLSKRVLLIDKRPHIGGNAYDRHDEAGILIHQYGPHIFHTNSAEIFQYLSHFTRWRRYEHRVLANVDEQLLPIPINRTTLNQLYGLNLETEHDTALFLAARSEASEPVRTAEDAVVSQVGRDLYNKFFRGYTRKQWGLDPSQLHRSVTARVPARLNDDDRYFTDKYQFMPAAGYTRMFESMLDHPNIHVMTATSLSDITGHVVFDQTIYTGPIDEYFDFRFGKLPYRSLKFRHETIERENFQPVATVNYPDEWTPYTRITEFKHLTGQRHPATSIVYEYPASEGDPYYPVPRPENQALFKRYEALAAQATSVHFVGRLATYRYYNMDQVVGQALATFRRIAGSPDASRAPSVGSEIVAGP
jgi:UDP-galactopyranose mutase